MLREEYRFEAAFLGRARQFANVNAIVRREIENTNTHCHFSWRVVLRLENKFNSLRIYREWSRNLGLDGTDARIPPVLA
jgi:hypothetical protein